MTNDNDRSIMDKWTSWNGTAYDLFGRYGELVGTTSKYATAAAHARRMEAADRRASR